MTGLLVLSLFSCLDSPRTRVMVHPGFPGTVTMLGWRSPEGGPVDVDVTVDVKPGCEGAHRSDGVTFSLQTEAGPTLWTGGVREPGPPKRFRGTVELAPGGSVFLAVEPRAEDWCDWATATFVVTDGGVRRDVGWDQQSEARTRDWEYRFQTAAGERVDLVHGVDRLGFLSWRTPQNVGVIRPEPRDRDGDGTDDDFDVLPDLGRAQVLAAAGGGAVLGLLLGIWALHRRRRRVARDREIARLQAQAEYLEALDSLRSKAITDVQHDLRSSVSLVLSPLEHRAHGEPLPPDLERVLRNANRVQALIEQLLDASQLDETGVPLLAVRGELAGVARDVAQRFRDDARHRGVTLSVGGDEGCEAWFDP